MYGSWKVWNSCQNVLISCKCVNFVLMCVCACGNAVGMLGNVGTAHGGLGGSWGWGEVYHSMWGLFPVIIVQFYLACSDHEHASLPSTCSNNYFNICLFSFIAVIWGFSSGLGKGWVTFSATKL